MQPCVTVILAGNWTSLVFFLVLLVLLLLLPHLFFFIIHACGRVHLRVEIFRARARAPAISLLIAAVSVY